MLRALPGFVTYPTDHCVTGSLKHVYDYHGFPVSEDLLLGLGRGLGFVYFHIKGTDPFYGGRANVARPGEEGLEKTAGRRAGVAVLLAPRIYSPMTPRGVRRRPQPGADRRVSGAPP
jgi:hypothetical protein